MENRHRVAFEYRSELYEFKLNEKEKDLEELESYLDSIIENWMEAYYRELNEYNRSLNALRAERDKIKARFDQWLGWFREKNLPYLEKMRRWTKSNWTKAWLTRCQANRG